MIKAIDKEKRFLCNNRPRVLIVHSLGYQPGAESFGSQLPPLWEKNGILTINSVLDGVKCNRRSLGEGCAAACESANVEKADRWAAQGTEQRSNISQAAGSQGR